MPGEISSLKLRRKQCGYLTGTIELHNLRAVINEAGESLAQSQALLCALSLIKDIRVGADRRQLPNA